MRIKMANNMKRICVYDNCCHFYGSFYQSFPNLSLAKVLKFVTLQAVVPK